jgi:hypothetical protein
MELFKRIAYVYLALHALIDLALGVIVYHQIGLLVVSIAIMAVPFSLSIILYFGLRNEKFRGRYGRRVILWREPVGYWFCFAIVVLIHLGITGAMVSAAYETEMTTGPEIPITFIGTVKSIEPLGERELRVIPVDKDSRFAVTVHIESVTPKQVVFEGSTDQVFAVEYPGALFLAQEEDVIGKKYRFKAAWYQQRNGIKFSNLTASRVEDEDTQ